ncbi:hypothetical protein ACFY7Y_14360 [Streptomyces virginiae]|uniref:hypothetical protein n=1 Tax=Streptomyces virginiae TaxID=1961 RepID=UPI0036C08E20
MNASDTALTCIGIAIGVALLIPCSWDAWHKARTHRRWRQSTGHDPQTVADDVIEARRERERAQLEAWLRLPSQPRNTIPQQRQPRKDQP